jgi:hypothetical protein
MVRRTVTGAVIFALCAISGWVFGQEASNRAFMGNKVTPIIKADVTGAPTKQVIANVYEVPAGSVVPRATFITVMNFITCYPANGPPRSREGRQELSSKAKGSTSRTGAGTAEK